MTQSPNKCHAVERGLRCSSTPPVGSKWCPRHEELQAKSLKTYKRFSYELEDYQECDIAVRCIKTCKCPEELHQWSQCLRKKWILTQRTAEARIKHHKLFYAGGDVSHQAFIDNLTWQMAILEEKLLHLDERAYELLKVNEKAAWLDQQAAIDPICEDPVASLVSVSSSSNNPPASPVLSATDTASHDTVSTRDTEEAEDTFSDIESHSGTSDTCTSPCCEKASNSPPTYRDRVLAYLDYHTYFIDDKDKFFATKYMNNILRYAISRIPSLLVRAKNADCPSVSCFLNSEDLQETEFARFWRGLKYNNVHPEGKLSVNVIRNALCDAEYETQSRKGAYIELLGGKVWKDATNTDMSRRAWDHFYRFTSCSGCALSVTHSFADWSTNRLLAQQNSRYSTWFDEQDTPAERKIRSCGIILCGSYRKGRLGSMEHVKPKKKGMRSVWIERESRNWCFLRMLPTPENEEKVQKLASTTLATCVWPREDAASIKPDGMTWVSRLRSGYNATDRRNARWTVESTFHFTYKTRERLLSTSPETCFHKGRPFADPSLDVLVIDSGSEQNYETFLMNIASRMSIGDLKARTSEAVPILDRALYLGRQMFREPV